MSAISEFRALYGRDKCRELAEEYARKAVEASAATALLSDTGEDGVQIAKDTTDLYAKVAGTYLAASVIEG